MQIQYNPIQLAESYARIRNEPVKLLPYQSSFLKDQSRFRIVNKSRKIGFSWLIALESVIDSLFTPQNETIIMSKDERASEKVIEYAKDILYSFPEAIKKFWMIKTESKTEFSFSNGSKIVCIACSTTSARSFDANSIYLDEFAFYNERERGRDIIVLSSAVPTISAKNGKLTIISTPNGKNNEFHRIFNEIRQTVWSKHTIHWSECYWLKPLINELKEAMPEPKEAFFKQEFCNAFLEALTGFISPELYDQCIDNTLTGIT